LRTFEPNFIGAREVLENYEKSLNDVDLKTKHNISKSYCYIYVQLLKEAK
jgi:hypothetical protein